MRDPIECEEADYWNLDKHQNLKDASRGTFTAFTCDTIEANKNQYYRWSDAGHRDGKQDVRLFGGKRVQ